jgi:hypothetical protein
MAVTTYGSAKALARKVIKGERSEKEMKRILTGLKNIGALALFVSGFCSCASNEVQNTEALLPAAGFRSAALSPQAYGRITPYKLETNTVNGNTFYTYANKQKGVIYIGGDKAYQRYRQLVLQQSIAEKEREARYSNYVDHIDQTFSEHL